MQLVHRSGLKIHLKGLAQEAPAFCGMGNVSSECKGTLASQKKLMRSLNNNSARGKGSQPKAKTCGLPALVLTVMEVS